jgi:putative nucleotidyltransferase with HDIG domain
MGGSLAVAEVPAGLARDIFERTGVAVAFYLPDGSPALLADGANEDSDILAPAAEGSPLGRLVQEVVEAGAGTERLESGPWGVRAAWPVMVRSRPALVVAAELPASGEGENRLTRRLMAAVAEAVRARIEEAAAQSERDQVADVLSQTFEEVSLLHNLSETLRVNRPSAELLEFVCSELRGTTGAEAAAAYLPATPGAQAETVIIGRLPLLVADLPALVNHILDSLGPEQFVLINNHVQDDPLLASFSIVMERLVLVPLPLGGGARGAIVAFNRRDEFGSPDVKLIRSSASASAVFIENRRLYDELQDLMLDLVRALVSSVDAKDPYTCGHSSRVAITSRELTRQLGLGDVKGEEAYLAGLLHDIGKIGTPEAILRKDGKLLPEEWEIIRQHPEVGGRIISGIRKLEPQREAVIHHHERIDGRGYPSGLKGDEIPLLARIVGLADAFDAMSSNRPYRPMLPLEHVENEIRRGIGTQFDAKVAEAFFRLDRQRLIKSFADHPSSVRYQG